jgi:hypothetical protein
MPTDQTELRRHLAATAARASAPRFTVSDVAVRVGRVRRRRAGIAMAVSAAAVVAAAVAVPFAVNSASTGTSAQQSASAFPPAEGTGPLPGSAKGAPVSTWTVTVNGGAQALPQSLADDPPKFDVAPGEKVTVAVTVTVPAHTEMTKFFLGITLSTGESGIGPRGPIGMKPVLTTAARLAPGTHTITAHWTVPLNAANQSGYQLAIAEAWPRGTANEPDAEELPVAGLGVSPGIPVPSAVVGPLRTQALRAAERAGDAKPDWIVAVRTTLAEAQAAVDPGGTTPGVNPGTPVYLVVAKGYFNGGSANPGDYLAAIVDAKTLAGYRDEVSAGQPTAALFDLGPLVSLTGGQAVHG